MRASGSLRIALLFVLSDVLVGCTPTASRLANDNLSGHLSGKVHGGQQPVTGATIQLYAVGAAGDQSAATPLLTQTVTTDQTGAFSFANDFTCPAANPLVYLVATGGNPGLATGTNNQSLAMMAALGSCSSLNSSTYVFINELTTVGSIAALYHYANGYAAFGSGIADQAALSTAFNLVTQYTNTSTGTVPGPSLPSTSYASSNEINTLANILSLCINSAGGTAGDGTPCGNLFALAHNPTSNVPTDTIGAVINILNNPTLNVTSIFNLVPANGAPFQPSRTIAPPDWSMPILTIPAPPTIEVSGTFPGFVNEFLSAFPSGPAIYYTTDGSIPTLASTLYTGSFSVYNPETINAIAVTDGRAISAPASANLTIDLQPATISVSSGSGQTTLIGNAFALPLQVLVRGVGQTGYLPANGATVTFTAPAGDVTLSSSTCTTNVSGLCSITATATQYQGTYTVQAEAANFFTANFTLTNALTTYVGPHLYTVAVPTDTTTGVATNCVDQNSGYQASNASCSLRDALAAAAAFGTSTTPATVNFSQTAPTTIYLANGALAIPSYTTIQGATSGSGTTLTNLITIDGSNATSVFTEASGVTQATLNNLTITHGSAYGSGNASIGGGIFMAGTLSVNNSTFSGNQAIASGGAISNEGGTLSVFGSTFVNNSAAQGFGGAIDVFSNGIATIGNSTFTANQGPYGGGIYSSGTATILDDTIVANTATYGAGVYNKGAMTIGNSIVNSNTSEDCGGVYCAANWYYVAFSAVTPSPVDSNNITIAFTDSLGNTFSQTVTYGQFSTPASLSAGFGPYFYENFSGLDTTGITGQGIGNLLVITPENGTTLSPFTIINPGQSFLATETFPALLLSVNHNVSGQTSAAIHLGPLASNGGPTQTMLPLSGSTALCVITSSAATGTDQRGQPRTAAYGNTSCQDAGAVQTSY